MISVSRGNIAILYQGTTFSRAAAAQNRAAFAPEDAFNQRRTPRLSRIRQGVESANFDLRQFLYERLIHD